MNGSDSSDSNDDFPVEQDASSTVDFNWEEDRVLSGGRRLKRERSSKKRTKPGTFGGPLTLLKKCDAQE